QDFGISDSAVVEFGGQRKTSPLATQQPVAEVVQLRERQRTFLNRRFLDDFDVFNSAPAGDNYIHLPLVAGPLQVDATINGGHQVRRRHAAFVDFVQNHSRLTAC